MRRERGVLSETPRINGVDRADIEASRLVRRVGLVECPPPRPYSRTLLTPALRRRDPVLVGDRRLLDVRRDGRENHYLVNLDAYMTHPGLKTLRLRDVLGELSHKASPNAGLFLA